MEHEIERLTSKLASGGIDDILKGARTIGGVTLVAGKVIDVDTKTLRGLVDNAKSKIGSGIVLMAAVQGDKISFIVSVTKDIEGKGFSAGTIALNFAKLIDGSGGGKPDFAQGGGKNTPKIDEALRVVAEKLR
jgi:alanyl-tRNA synthetase